ncbi:F45G2.10 [Ecytonucleospora hepatopenaei]|uniref:F45G2.10 n=1 Tax=Ecytonucleospora hepatopenaei TaxID=646526 RepID=A0A1W0E5V4_9MICR|nr:F45G2.10 [Ecytonucleospora hepatopenaei]
MDNSSPAINKTKIKREVIATEKGFVKNVTKATVFEVLRDITDPEHPYTLEELSVISLKNIEIFKKEKNQDSICTKGLPINTVRIIFTPTVPHCS